MKLKVGDLVAFKKYEDMNEWVRLGISKDSFPEFGRVSGIYDKAQRFFIEDEPYMFSEESVDYIIVKGATDDISVGDEVLVKATIVEAKGTYILPSWVSKDNVVKVLKRKKEQFIVQEDHYGMYVNESGDLTPQKQSAKIYKSRNDANDEATDMHLNAWEVIPYDN